MNSQDGHWVGHLKPLVAERFRVRTARIVGFSMRNSIRGK